VSASRTIRGNLLLGQLDFLAAFSLSNGTSNVYEITRFVFIDDLSSMYVLSLPPLYIKRQSYHIRVWPLRANSRRPAWCKRSFPRDHSRCRACTDCTPVVPSVTPGWFSFKEQTLHMRIARLLQSSRHVSRRPERTRREPAARQRVTAAAEIRSDHRRNSHASDHRRTLFASSTQCVSPAARAGRERHSQLGSSWASRRPTVPSAVPGRAPWVREHLHAVRGG